MTKLPQSLGELRRSRWSEERIANRSVRQEMRENVLELLAGGQPLFPGIHGFDDTVIPQIVNAVLSRHNFILLGLRGQAKSQILRSLAQYLRASTREWTLKGACAGFSENPVLLLGACRS